MPRIERIERTLQFNASRPAYQNQIDAACSLGPAGVATDLGSGLVALLLRICLTHADVNALCCRPMFVLSAAQARTLLDAAGLTEARTLLDVGAGDGAATACLAESQGIDRSRGRVRTTEVSVLLAARLTARGWDCAVEELPSTSCTPARYALVSCLNVLCRCARPLTLLRRLRPLVADDGLLLLGVVLPFRPVVLGRCSRRAAPSEHLPPALLRARTFEESARLLVELVLAPLGFAVAAWTRTPYLSRRLMGGLAILDDACFALRVEAPPD